MRHVFIFTAGLLLCGCSGAPLPGQPTATPRPAAPTPASPAPINGANWIGEAIVVSSAGSAACGWGTTAGDTRSDVLWRIGINGDSLMLDEDMRNWPTDDIPFFGTLNGTRFSAAYTEQPSGVCMFRGGTLSGSFSDDGRTFDATETLEWGAASGQPAATVQRRWTGRRL